VLERIKVIRIWEGENSETLVRIYYIDDVVDNIVWKYSVSPLPRLCKEREKVGKAIGLNL